MFFAGTRNEICVSLVYSGNVNEILFPFPLYTRETQISFLVPGFLRFLQACIGSGCVSLLARVRIKMRVTFQTKLNKAKTKLKLN